MTEGVTDAFRSRRNDSRIAIGARPSIGVDARHDVSSAACLSTEGRGHASTVHLAGHEGCWCCTDNELNVGLCEE